MIVIVFGLPGSGKSFFASRLAKQLNAAYINSDQERIKMFKHRQYSEAERMAVYNHLYNKATEAIATGSNLVIDGTFFRQDLRQPYLDELNESVIFIEIVTNKGTARKRLSRSRPFSEADYDVYKMFKKKWEPMEQDHLILQSNDDNIGEMMNLAMVYLHKYS